jgi:ATP-dependent Clp protease ATP-binding subunit ClpA
MNNSPAVCRILKRAAIEAEATGKSNVEVTHLLIAIAQEGQNVGAQLFSEKEITVEGLRAMDFKQ